MNCTVFKARHGTPRSTVVMCAGTRDAIQAAYGRPPTPGYAVQVQGSAQCCPRNLIVLRMKRDDSLLGRTDAVRIGPSARKRLGVSSGDTVDIVPFKWARCFHGTEAEDPMVIVNDGWIVGEGNVFGSGVYLARTKSEAAAYTSTGLITTEVAWGRSLDWPPAEGSELHAQLALWAREKSKDFDDLLELEDLDDEDDPRTADILRWARLYGHYRRAGDGVRVFPGPVGSGYKPNRLRVVKVEDPEGEVLWQRARLPR